jgi:purine-nucleoside phosphorylase
MIPFEHYQESAKYIRGKIGGFQPEILLILGSGLGQFGDGVENPIIVPYKEIPHFRHSTAPGHKGRFVFGTIAGKRVAVMQGRIHLYEGYTPEEAVYGVRVMKLLGVKTMIVTNAGGAVNLDYKPGQIMLISDQILLFPMTPLIGPNDERFGVRFPDMSTAYTPSLRALAREAAKETGVHLNEGVYIYFPGPQYETPAEIRAARLLGADAVGMSTVPEVIAARHCGMDILGFSLSTNMAAGILDQPLTEEEVLETGEACKESFSKLMLRILQSM